jgi:hypothetical protein
MHQLSLILLLSLSITCHAQSYCKYKPKYKINPDNYGVFLIVHGTSYSAPTAIMPTNRTKLNTGFGFYLYKRLLRNEYLKIETSFIQKGGYYSFNSLELLRLNYIEIPILWSHIFLRRKKTFHFECGFAYSQLIFSSRQIELYAEQSPDLNAKNFKNYDIPIILALFAPLNSKGKDNLEVGLRYSYSPCSIHKSYRTESMDMFKDDGIHHMTYGIQFVYKFK